MSNNIIQRQKRYKKYLNRKICYKYILYFSVALSSSIILCFVLMLCSHIYANKFYSGEAHELGDSFGSVNAIISTLAFLGVFLALIMQQKQIELQRKELALQRRELKNNTKELSLQRKEFEEQNRNIRLQRFENTFFQMLTLHHEIVGGLKVRIEMYETKGTDAPPVLVEGREIFQVLYNEALVLTHEGISEIIAKYGIQGGYSKIRLLALFDHYFRNLYRIFKFIDTTPERDLNNKDDRDGVLTLDEKRNYAAIVRASLSEYELVLLFFNCLHMRDVIDEPQFKGFAEKYHLFNNIRPDKVGSTFDTFSKEYEDSAFNW